MTQKQLKIFYPTIFFLGLILMIFQIEIYRNTIINSSIPIICILIVGITAYFIDFKNYKKTYAYGGLSIYLYSAMHYIFGFGFIVCSIFMIINYSFADDKKVKETFEIVRISYLPGRIQNSSDPEPTFQINYYGKIKELVFSQEYYKRRNNFTNVELEIRKGYFGFDIIENKTLK